MTTRTQTPGTASRLGLCSLAMGTLLSVSGCLSIGEEKNQPPIAVVETTVGGMPVRVVAQSVGAAIYTVNTAPRMVMLDGSQSVDPEGGPITFEWWNTGIPRAMRFPASVPVGGTGPAPVDPATLPTTPDGTGPSLPVNIPAGGAIFSLYVTDAAGNISIPATLKFTTH